MTALDLSYDGVELTGTVDRQPVRLALQVPHSNAIATGSFGDARVDVQWQIGDGSTEHPGVPVSLHGSFDGEPVSLSATFQYGSAFFLASAVIDGAIGGAPFRAAVAPAAGGWSSSTVRVEGNLAETAFSLFATIAGGMSQGLIRGAVGDRPIRLHAVRNAGRKQISGEYAGPPALLVLCAGALLYFM